MAIVKILLVLHLLIPGQPPEEQQHEVPSIEVCTKLARQFLEEFSQAPLPAGTIMISGCALETAQGV